jgi:alpha/beta superfamily hydrolase/aryl carrier-like protein
MTLDKHDSAIDRVGECQARLAQLWEKNLGVPIKGDDDYFQMGGDSLHGSQLLAWIREGFGVELSLLDLFESRTLAAVTRLILAAQAGTGPATEKPPTEYLFFGPADVPLFGALHRPGANNNQVGVVLCYPIGQEYMRIHRTYAELAKSLATAGHHVLRFDYFGCGDSAGETSAGNLERWRDDIRQAIRELHSRSGVRSIYLVGARVGANLVLGLRPAREDVAGVVLWEPIVGGAEYIAALRRAHHDLLDSNAVLDGYEQHEPPDCFAELVGFPFTKQLYDEVAAIDLLGTPVSNATPDCLVIANSHKPALESYVTARAGGPSKLDYVAVNESDAIWLKEDRQNKGVIPAQAVQAIVSWISRRAA